MSREYVVQDLLDFIDEQKREIKQLTDKVRDLELENESLRWDIKEDKSGI